MLSKIIKFAKRNYLLVAILTISLLIRVVGLVPGYNPYHPDEGMSYASAVKMAINGNFNPERFDYPSGVPLVHFLIYSLIILPLVKLKIMFQNPAYITNALTDNSRFLRHFQIDIFGKSDINALFWSRYITAFLGAAAVLATYLTAVKLFDKKTGLFAAFFLSVNYRHVFSSHIAVSDVPNSLFAILAFLSSVLVFRKNSLKNYLLAGLAMGASFAMKYQLFPVFSFLAAHLCGFFRKRKISDLFNRKILLSFFVMLFVFGISNIHLFLNRSETLYWLNIVSLRYGSGANRLNFYPIYYLFYFGIGPLPFIAVLLGVLTGLIFEPRKTILLLSYAIPFFFVLLYYMSGGTYVRNFTTVMPFLMIFAGFLFSRIFAFLGMILKNKSFASLLILLLLFTVNFEPFKNSLILSSGLLKPWNRDVLTAWSESKLPGNAKVANDNLGINFINDYIEPWNVNGENSVAELQEKKYDFAVANIDWRQSLLYWWFKENPRDLIKQGPLPYLILDNSYNGIALIELLNYAVFEVYKPWQAPEINYFIAKIPPKITVPGKLIADYNFNSADEGWRGIDIYNSEKPKGFYWDRDGGNKEKGSLVYEGGHDRRARYSSPLIPVRQDKVYTAAGFLKTENILLSLRERDVFLRLDFYEEDERDKIGAGGFYKSVSARVFGTKDWVERQTTAKAPKNARFLTVSFQKDSASSKMWLDDVRIFEAEAMPENYSDVPYIQATMPKEVIYPNSII